MQALLIVCVDVPPTVVPCVLFVCVRVSRTRRVMDTQLHLRPLVCPVSCVVRGSSVAPRIEHGSRVGAFFVPPATARAPRAERAGAAESQRRTLTADSREPPALRYTLAFRYTLA